MIVGIRNKSGVDLFLAVTVRGKRLCFALFSRKPSKIKTQALPASKDFGISNCQQGTRTVVDTENSEISLFAAKKTRRLVRLDDKNQTDGKESYILYTIRLAN